MVAGTGVGLVLGLLMGGCPQGTFSCSDDTQCEGGEGEGRCEIDGYCSFPDGECPSGRRYGEHASSGIAGECVDPQTAQGSGGPGSGPDTGADPSGGTSGRGTATDDAGTDASATGQPGEISFTDDQWRDEFGAGSVEGLVWDGSAVRLDPDLAEGTLISRPFDAGQPVDWTSLAWWAMAPYGKPLPDGGAAERGYPEDGVDMQGNLLLLHLDLPQGPLPEGELVVDASGTGHDAVLDGDAATGVSGRFGMGLEFTAGTRLLVDPTNFEPVEDDFSWAVWVRLADDCSGAHAFVGFDSAESNDSANIWLACLSTDSIPACAGEPGGRAVFVASATQSGGGGGTVCSATTIDDGQWHHVVATKQGHSPSTLRVYVDGKLDDETMAAIDGPLVFPPDVELSIGAHPGGTFPMSGALDEVAIWERALVPEEIAAMYRRGVLRLELRVRACDEPTCADEAPFEGPGGGLQPFVDSAPALVSGALHPLMLDGSVLQYRARLESLVPGLSPGLAAVTVSGIEP